MFLCFYFFFRVIQATRCNVSGLLSSDGIDLTQINDWKEIKRILDLIFSPDTHVGDLLLNYLNYNNIKNTRYTPELLRNEYQSYYRFFIDNNSRVKDIPMYETHIKSFANSIFKATSKIKSSLIWSSSSFAKLHEVLREILENSNKTTVEDIVEALNIDISYYFNTAEIAKHALLVDNFTVKEVPPKLFMDSNKIMKIFNDISETIKDDKLTLYEINSNLYSLINLIGELLKGVKVLFMKSLLTLLTPYATIAPESKFLLKNIIKFLIQAFNQARKNVNVNDFNTQLILNKTEPIIDNLREQLSTHTIKIPRSIQYKLMKSLLIQNPDIPILCIAIPNMYLFIFNRKGILFNIRRKDKDLFRPLLNTIYRNKIKNYYKTIAAIIYLNNNKRQIPGFSMSWSEKIIFGAKYFKNINLSSKINEILAIFNMKPMNTIIIKKSISELINILLELRNLHPVLIKYVIELLNNMKNVVKEDLTLEELLKINSLSNSFAQFIDANNKYNNGLSAEKAFWNFEIFDIYIMRTIEAWKTLKVQSVPNLIDAIVTKTKERKIFIANFRKLINLAIKNNFHMTSSDISLIYPGFNKFIEVITPILNFILMSPTDFFKYSADIDISKFTDSLHLFLQTLQYGSVSWDIYVKMNSRLYNNLYKPLFEKYGKGKLTKPIRNMILFASILLVIARIVVLVSFIVIFTRIIVKLYRTIKLRRKYQIIDNNENDLMSNSLVQDLQLMQNT